MPCYHLPLPVSCPFAGMLLSIVAFSQLLFPVWMKETTGLFRGLKDLMSDMQVCLVILITKRRLRLIQSTGNRSFQKYISVTSHLIGQVFVT
jgi:hypothetical protein